MHLCSKSTAGCQAQTHNAAKPVRPTCGMMVHAGRRRGARCPLPQPRRPASVRGWLEPRRGYAAAVQAGGERTSISLPAGHRQRCRGATTRTRARQPPPAVGPESTGCGANGDAPCILCMRGNSGQTCFVLCSAGAAQAINVPQAAALAASTLRGDRPCQQLALQPPQQLNKVMQSVGLASAPNSTGNERNTRTNAAQIQPAAAHKSPSLEASPQTARWGRPACHTHEYQHYTCCQSPS